MTFAIQGQVWVDQGAVWHYDWSNISSGGFVKIIYDSDTTIYGKNCQKLVPIIFIFTADQNHNTIFLGTDTLSPKYTYVNGDTVFYFENNQFFTLYNFNAQPGETWELAADTNIFLCSKSFVKVDSVGVIEINSESLRWISVRPLENSTVGLYGKVVERFGAVENYLFPVERSCDSTIQVEFDWFDFTCFQDNSFALYNVSGLDCEYLLGIDENDSKQPTVSVYPNPAYQIINIITNDLKQEIVSIQIIDSKGMEWIISKETTIDISNLPQGLYLIMIKLNSNQLIYCKLIKNNTP